MVESWQLPSPLFCSRSPQKAYRPSPFHMESRTAVRLVKQLAKLTRSSPSSKQDAIARARGKIITHGGVTQ